MLTPDVATNLLATAMWEVAIVPLYRGGSKLARRRDLKRGPLQEALSDAGRHLATIDSGRGVSSANWKQFFAQPEVTAVVRDLFVFRLDEDVSTDEIEVAFCALWREFADKKNVAPDAVDIQGAYLILLECVNLLLDQALSDSILEAHEAKSAARHRVVLTRLDRLRALVDPDRSRSEPNSQELDDFETRLRAEVGARHAKIDPPSLQGGDRVPIDELYVAPTLKPSPGGERLKSVPLTAFLATSFRRVVLGNPGAGKSTLTYKICSALVNDYEAGLANDRRLTPWRIELRKFAVASEQHGIGLVDYFALFAAKSHQLDVPDGSFECLLNQGRLFVIFDGLDELLDVSTRLEVRDEVESFCRRFERTPVLVTSRHVDYARTPLDPCSFDAFHLGDFDGPQIAEYAAKWFRRDQRLDTTEQDEKAAAFLAESSIVPDLCRNPLMLALLCAFYGGRGYIPRNLPDVYGNCAQLLFDTWDRSRGIVAELSFSEHIRPALDDLAFWIFTDPKLSATGATRAQAIERTTDFLHRRRFADRSKAASAAAQFIDHCRGRAWVFSDRSVTADGIELFGFTHRTFLEFFAAECLAASYVTPEALVEALIEHISKSEWQVVTRVALQLKARALSDGADAVVDALRNQAKERPSESATILSFVLRSLGSIVPSPTTAQKLLSQTLGVVEAKLERNDTSEAVSLLADLGQTGAELSDQLVDAAVLVLADAVRRSSSRTAGLASEIALLNDGAWAKILPDDEPARRFWATVRIKTLSQARPVFEERAAHDREVALSLAAATADVGTLLDGHGFSAAFTPVQRRLGRFYHAPLARQLLQRASETHGAPPARLVTQFARVGVSARGTAVPWVEPEQTLVFTLAVPPLSKGLGAWSDWDLKDPDALFGVWAISAFYTELNLGAKRRRSELPPPADDMVTLANGLAVVLDHRRGWYAKPHKGGSPPSNLDSALQACGFLSADRRMVHKWATGAIDLLSFPPETRRYR